MLALFARVGHASGQDLACSDDRGKVFPDDDAWRKGVHALFGIRELILGRKRGTLMHSLRPYRMSWTAVHPDHLTQTTSP